MPSLFSRSRTHPTSTPANKPSLISPVSPTASDTQPFDEFGRINSRSSHFSSSTVKREKDRTRKKKGKGPEKLRSRTPGAQADLDGLPPIPIGSFLPFSLDRPRDESGHERPKGDDYGYLSYERHVILGVEQAEHLVDVVVDELNTRGLTTPFIFSSLALNISTSAIKRLIQTFLRTCTSPGSEEAHGSWLEEARFAGPHELGMFLRWGLARLVRFTGTEELRGLIPWDVYDNFSDSEAGSSNFSLAFCA